jgi:hypothetical protein
VQAIPEANASQEQWQARQARAPFRRLGGGLAALALLVDVGNGDGPAPLHLVHWPQLGLTPAALPAAAA